MEGVPPDKPPERGGGRPGRRRANRSETPRLDRKNTQTKGTPMTRETVEQLKDRLRKDDEEIEEAFQKRLKQLRADTAKYRAEKEAEDRTKQQERERLLAGVRESRER